MTAGDDTAPPAGTVSLDDLTPTSRERIVAAALHRQQMQQVRREVEMGIPTSLHEDVQPPWRCLGCLVAADVALRAAAAVDTALPGSTAVPRAGDTARAADMPDEFGPYLHEALGRPVFARTYVAEQHAELARLRSEAAALRAAGDALATAAESDARIASVNSAYALEDAVLNWRSAVGSPITDGEASR